MMELFNENSSDDDSSEDGSSLGLQYSIDEVSSFQVEEEATDFGKENDEGAIEYKWKLIDKDAARIQKLATQMHYRLSEGMGEATYRLGVEDDGNPIGLSEEELGQSLHTIRTIANVLESNKAFVQVSLTCVSKGIEGKVGEVKVSRLSKEMTRDSGEQVQCTDIKICCTGCADSGKSTLIGVLTTQELDDGDGSARQDVFRHVHELKKGRTSSISRHLLGFNMQGKVTNKSDWEGSDWSDSGSDWSQIVEDSNKVITFVDLAGHEAYIKTTMFGLVSQFPDYGLMFVAADKGLSRMTKQHLGLTLALNLALLVVVTKIDLCTEEQVAHTVRELKEVLQEVGGKLPIVVKEPARGMHPTNTFNPDVTPIFLVSSVTGQGLPSLKSWLHVLPRSSAWRTTVEGNERRGCGGGGTEEKKVKGKGGDVVEEKRPATFFIDSNYDVEDVGTVVHGTLMSGEIKIKTSLLLGPDDEGRFREVKCSSIHVKKSAVARVKAGTSAALALHGVDRHSLRKGMVLCHPSLEPKPSFGFEATIRVLHHRTCVRNNYEAILIFGTATQAARITALHPSLLRSGEKGLARFYFNQRPEFVQEGLPFVFRAGHARGVGQIIRALHDPPSESTVRPRKGMKERRNTH